MLVSPEIRAMAAALLSPETSRDLFQTLLRIYTDALQRGELSTIDRIYLSIRLRRFLRRRVKDLILSAIFNKS